MTMTWRGNGRTQHAVTVQSHAPLKTAACQQYVTSKRENEGLDAVGDLRGREGDKFQLRVHHGKRGSRCFAGMPLSVTRGLCVSTARVDA